MKNASKLFFSSFLLLILSGCLQNPKNKPVIEHNSKTNNVVTNQDIPEWDYRRFPNCDWLSRGEFLDLIPSEVVLYLDTTHGISLEVPFNSKWQVAECPSVPPFEKHKNEDGIAFGPVGPWDDRIYSLLIKPRLSMEKTMESKQIYEKPIFKKHKLNGVSMLEYFPSSPAKCSGSSLIVFGEKNNFELSSPCVFPQEGIENNPIVKSIRLLPN